MPSNSVRKGRAPAEYISVGGGVAAALSVVAAGAGLSAALPEASPWLTAAAYLAPASLAFAAYWWMAQRE
jgi:threonine/homoserine/homoserine lactone efflux protein